MSARALGMLALRGLAATWLCACARAPVGDPLADAFDARGVSRAAELAPDLYGRAVRARHEVATASGEDARSNARDRAELWLEAAVVEAQRIEAQRAASAAEARTVEAEARRVEALRERGQLERQLTLVEAGRVARARAERMLAGGALAEAALRGDAVALAEATGFTLERASLLLAAARALGLEPGLAGARVAPLASRLDALAAQPDSRPRLLAALELLEALERALGEARLSRPGPTAEEQSSLRADAAERGLALELQPHGARLTLDARAFAPGRADASAQGAHALAQLAALLRLHPRGPIELETGTTALAARRAHVLAKRLGAPRSVVRVASAPGSSTDAIAVVLPAYGTAAVAPSAPLPQPLPPGR